MFAIRDAYRSGLFQPQNWLANILAGVIVGVIALPLSMAFAIASGAKPEQGLYTAIIAALLVALFGGSRVQIAGPTGAFIVILATITAQHGIVGLQLATLMAGIILLLMGIFRLGDIFKYIPQPVITGFTIGIGFIIFVGQWKDFLGLQIQLPIDASFVQKITVLTKNVINFDPITLALAVLSLFLVIATTRISKRIPGPLIAMFVVTALQAIFQFKSVATIGSVFGGIPSKLPSLHMPNFTLSSCITLLGPAVTIALLAAVESLLSAAVADGMTNGRHNSNAELIGQGLANIFAPIFGGFAATGAIARTATSIRNGGNSPLAAIIHSIVLIAIILLLSPLVANIPLSCLAAILFVVAYNMSDVPHVVNTLKKAPREDSVVLVATFLFTIFANLVVAVAVGVVVSLLFFVRSMHHAVAIKEQPLHEYANELQLEHHELPKDTIIYSIHGPFFFAAAQKLAQTLGIIHQDPKSIVLRLKHVPFVDMTGIAALKETIERFKKRGVQVVLSEANSHVAEKLQKMGITKLVEEGTGKTSAAS